MAAQIPAVKGMNDLLPSVSGRWQRVEAQLRELANQYGYEELRTPIAERSELFVQSIGDDTDIVSKEMYTFTDIGGDSLTLRPEATASSVRACLKHGLLHNRQQRIWYMGPMFRHERPQKGRYRQFHQFGIEAYGWAGPDIDAEIILVAAQIWQALDIKGITLQLNSLGSDAIRANYRDALVSYFNDHHDKLDEDSLRRLQSNPMRILDSKIPQTQALVADAPLILDFFDGEAQDHFSSLQSLLDQLGITYTVNPHLVRGLDYYTSTVFEWVTDQLGAQGTVLAGGRYDNLIAKSGGRATPGIGFAMGLERLLALHEEQHAAQTGYSQSDVFIMATEPDYQAKAMALGQELRQHGLRVVNNHGTAKLKSLMKRADQSTARYALILGADEMASQCVSLIHLRSQQAQQTVAWSDLADHLQRIDKLPHE